MRLRKKPNRMLYQCWLAGYKNMSAPRSNARVDRTKERVVLGSGIRYQQVRPVKLASWFFNEATSQQVHVCFLSSRNPWVGNIPRFWSKARFCKKNSQVSDGNFRLSLKWTKITTDWAAHMATLQCSDVSTSAYFFKIKLNIFLDTLIQKIFC